MPDDSADTLRYLFGLQPEQITADLRSAPARTAELDAEIAAHRAMPRSVTTAAQRALCCHREILRAHALACRPGLPEDLQLYLAVWPLDHIAEQCAEAAIAHGQLALLTAELDAIRAREGLTPDEYWPKGEGPEDHEAAEEAVDRAMERICEGIVSQLIRRYFGNTLADHFEESRGDFEVRRETGRRLAMKGQAGSAEYDRQMAEEILRKYGRPAHKELQRRLKAAGL